MLQKNDIRIKSWKYTLQGYENHLGMWNVDLCFLF